MIHTHIYYIYYIYIDRSGKPSTPQVRDRAGTLVSPILMLKHKAVVYCALPHK